AALAEASRKAGPDATGLSPVPPLAWLTAAPMPGGVGVERIAGATALAEYSRQANDYPVLIRGGKFVAAYLQQPDGLGLMPLNHRKVHPRGRDKPARPLLDTKKTDLPLSAAPDFWTQLDGGQPAVTMEYRDNDEHSRLTALRLHFVLARW